MAKPKKCPCCGHPLADDSVPPVGLTAIETRIFQIVSRHSPLGIFGQRELMALVYADRPDGGPEHPSVIRKHICNMNKKLKLVRPRPLRIQGRRGYRLIEIKPEPAAKWSFPTAGDNLSMDQGHG